MRRFFSTVFLLTLTSALFGQSTFKAGWDTHKTAAIIHEYTYSYTFKDSLRLYLADSSKTFVAVDSAATLVVNFPFHDNITYKTANYYNSKKKLVKTEEYRENAVENIKEYKYDDKGRKTGFTETNKLNGNVVAKDYSYSVDKASGDNIEQETSHFNGRVEFFTRSFVNKAGVKYKEIRLNDNNKDVVHVENFKYSAGGRLVERTVFFPEFKVTKKFEENGGDEADKCYVTQYVNITDPVSVRTKVGYLKKLMQKNRNLLFDVDCHTFEYRFFGKDIDVVISTTKVNNIKQVVIRIKERLIAGSK